MSCCGASNARPTFNPAPMQTSSMPGTTTFQYTGKTRLTVIGPVTRRRYEFDRPGARVAVDRNDGNSFAGVPTLRRL